MAKHEAVKSAIIEATVGAGSVNTTIVAAVAGKKIRVLGYVLVVGAAGMKPKWFSAAGGTAKIGALPLGANGGVSAPVVDSDLSNPRGVGGWFETVAGEALVLNTQAAGDVGGHVLYQEI